MFKKLLLVSIQCPKYRSKPYVEILYVHRNPAFTYPISLEEYAARERRKPAARMAAGLVSEVLESIRWTWF
jgi:hypothetical protein